MAVPFNLPQVDSSPQSGGAGQTVHNNNNQGTTNSSQSSSATSSANHSPILPISSSSASSQTMYTGSSIHQPPSNNNTSVPHSPVLSPSNNEHLVQAICEALYRCSMGSNHSSGSGGGSCDILVIFVAQILTEVIMFKVLVVIFGWCNNQVLKISWSLDVESHLTKLKIKCKDNRSMILLVLHECLPSF